MVQIHLAFSNLKHLEETEHSVTNCQLSKNSFIFTLFYGNMVLSKWLHDWSWACHLVWPRRQYLTHARFPMALIFMHRPRRQWGNDGKRNMADTSVQLIYWTIYTVSEIELSAVNQTLYMLEESKIIPCKHRISFSMLYFNIRVNGL